MIRDHDEKAAEEIEKFWFNAAVQEEDEEYNPDLSEEKTVISW
jgi:hypothetical protein